MHIDDERIQRFLHGELSAAASQEVDRHLAECASCRRRIEEARREEEWIFDLLRRADHASPDVDPESVVVRAHKARAVEWAQWAAGFLLAVVFAGAAYTAPGSPLPAWVDRVTEWFTGRPGQAPAPESAPSPTTTSGIAVAPRDHLVIRFAAPQSEGSARVTLTGGPDVVVRVTNGTATFTTDVDRLTIENQGSRADYEIDLPQSAAWVEIQVGDRRVLLKQGAGIVTDASTDARGRYILSLASSQP